MANRADESKSQPEPTVAPGMNTHDELEAEATDEEKAKGDYTEVTRLYLDHTPED